MIKYAFLINNIIVICFPDWSKNSVNKEILSVFLLLSPRCQAKCLVHIRN